MKLSELETIKLLPQFAKAYEYACKALDQWMAVNHTRSNALSQPWTLESIAALTEAELQEAYKTYSDAVYYPDLSRQARNEFLYEQIVNIRKKGTKTAIQSLMQYIYKDMSVSIDDDLAFDKDGNLVDASMLHKYMLSVGIDPAEMPDYLTSRILDNIRKFMRASAALYSLSYTSDAEISATPLMVNGIRSCGITEDVRINEQPWGICIFYDNDMASTSGHSVSYVKLIRFTLEYPLASSKALIDRTVIIKDRLDIMYKTDGISNYTYDNTLATYSTMRARVKACYDYVDGSFTAADGCFGVYKNAPTITQIQRLYRSDFE